MAPTETSAQQTANLLQPLLLRVEEAAHLLGLGRSKVYAMIAQVEIPYVQLGTVRRIARAALLRWIEEHTVYGTMQ